MSFRVPLLSKALALAGWVKVLAWSFSRYYPPPRTPPCGPKEGLEGLSESPVCYQEPGSPCPTAMATGIATHMQLQSWLRGTGCPGRWTQGLSSIHRVPHPGAHVREGQDHQGAPGVPFPEEGGREAVLPVF